MTIAESPSTAEHSFDRAANKAVKDLQRACGELLSELPGDVRRAVDVERGLNVDKRLAWQVFKLVSSPEPLAEVANIPAPRSMRRFFEAAANARVRRSVITRVSTAFDKFERFVSDHGGGRFEFVSAVRGLGHPTDERSELNIRKSLFRGQAHVWGVQVGTMIRSLIHYPPNLDQSNSMDAFLLRGDIGLRRLRRSAPLTFRAFLRVTEGARDDQPALQGEVSELKILPEFSTDPLPEMAPTKYADGSVRTELIFPPAGRKGAINLYTAQGATVRWEGDKPLYVLSVLVREPAETLVAEMLVPAGLSDPGTARVAIYGSRGAVQEAFQCRPSDLLPQRETIVHVGPVDTAPPVLASPHHPQAVTSLFKRAGKVGTLFDVYRCTIQYPVLHTMTHIAVDALPVAR